MHFQTARIVHFGTASDRSMLRGIRVSSKEELKDRMSQYIDDMNETPTIFKWKYKMDKMAGGIVVDKDSGVLIC